MISGFKNIFISVTLEPSRYPVFIDPPHIYNPAWKPFEIICRSATGSPVSAVFAHDGSRVDSDPRFRVSTYNDSTIIISAPKGLRDVDDLAIR